MERASNEPDGELEMPSTESERALVVTSLVDGILSPEDREAWLRNHSQDSADWTDDEILVAIGSGMA